MIDPPPWTALLLPLPVLLALAGCAPSEPRPANVLLIVVDTLRQDHLGCYGYGRETSPAIDALAAESARFDRAYTTAPWTMPAVASMFTGLYPTSHGLTRTARLSEDALTLAEILQHEGYGTAAVVSHSLVTGRFRFDQGFESYDESEAEKAHDNVSTPGVTARAGELLRGFSEQQRPFFLFLHYFDPHYSYKHHPEYGFAPPAVGRLDGTEDIHDLRDLMYDLSPEELQFIRNLYDGEIRHTDEGIGRVLETLRELDLWEDTIVVLTADHGEEFLTHGWLGHTRTLYDELVRVPLIVREPGRSGPPTTVDRVVSLTSLPATVLDLAGFDPAGFGFQGPSLRPLLNDPHGPGPPWVFSEVDFIPILRANRVKTTFKKAIATERYKLVRDDVSGRIEVYDLRSDPRELDDLSAERPDLVAELLPMLEEGIRTSRAAVLAPEEMQLPEELIEKLRNLGYVGR